MTELRVAEAVCGKFPGFLIAVVVAEGLDGRTPWPPVDAELAALEADPPPEDDPHITSWREAYRAFGTNPKRQRPSVDALRRRLARNGRLPRITPLVDVYNLVSARYAVPAGAFDLDMVAGDVQVRPAVGDEEFTPLGEPGVVEHPGPGEVIYHDAKAVLTRHWNHRDADRTKVTPGSVRVAFLLETADSAAFGDLVRRCAADLAGRLDERAGEVRLRELCAATPAVLLLPFTLPAGHRPAPAGHRAPARPAQSAQPSLGGRRRGRHAARDGVAEPLPQGDAGQHGGGHRHERRGGRVGVHQQRPDQREAGQRRAGRAADVDDLPRSRHGQVAGHHDARQRAGED